MTEQVVTILVALVGGGFLGSIVQGIFQRRKLGADYADVIARSATTLLQPLSERVEELQAQVNLEQERARQLARDLQAAHESLERARVAIRVLRNELAQARGDKGGLR